MILEDYLDTEFHTVCEDGSIEELSELFIQMKRECDEGIFNLATVTQSRKRSRQDVLTQSKGIDTEGDAVDECDRDDEVKDLNEEVIATANEISSVPIAPIVDEDGFEQVSSRRRKKK